MPVPSWVGEAREQMFEGHQGLDYDKAEVKPRELPVVENFSNLFAEYEVRDRDLLVHVFARGGESDRYWPGELKKDGTYIPGRLEHTIDITGPSFPNDIVNRIKTAVDKVWQGDVAIDKATILRYEDTDDVAEDDVADVLAVGAGAGQGFAHDQGAQFGGRAVLEAAPEGTDGGTDSADDDDFTAHGNAPLWMGYGVNGTW